MFFQPPSTELTPTDCGTSHGSQKSARRKRKKRAQKFKNKKLALKKEKQRFANTMSSWAENFTMAATWQLKHQVAHWKSKARALEYENQILRDLLRRNYVKGEHSTKAEVSETTTASEDETDADVEYGEDETDMNEENVENYNNGEEDEFKMEMSEEFFAFLKGNTEFRKKRLERERLRKLEEEMPTKVLEASPEEPTDTREEYQRLYGSKWQRIAALEMSLQSQFMSDCDKHKPALWPILPLRF